MSRTTQACYALICTAFVTTALIFLQASSLMESSAQAEMVVNRNAVTMLTARFQAGEEILYVLDSNRERLFAYSHNPSKQTIELLDSVDISRVMQAEPAGGNAKPGQPRRPVTR